MLEVSIICLIYKSKKLAKAVYDSAYKYTPKLRNGQAEFLFVANDPTSELVDYLEDQRYPYIINVNDHLQNEELFKLGYGAPEYMRRVYQGYNQGILAAKAQKVVLINSDNFFSDDWLENLLKYSDYKKVVCTTLVEPGHDKFGVFPAAIEKDFGHTTEEYQESDFQQFVSKTSKTGYTSGGAYMPCLMYKDVAILAGLYPEGNLAGKSFENIKRFGDEYFYDKLRGFGVEHITAKDSIVYHLKEGEKSEGAEDDVKVVEDVKYRRSSYDVRHAVKPTELIAYIKPDVKHTEILNELGNKFTVVLAYFSNQEELLNQVEKIRHLEIAKLEVIALTQDPATNTQKIDGVKYIFAPTSERYVALSKLIYSMYGEFLLVPYGDFRFTKQSLLEVTDKSVNYCLPSRTDEQGVSVYSSGDYVFSKRLVLNNLYKYILMMLNPENNENIKKLKKDKFMTLSLAESDNQVDLQGGIVKQHTVAYRVARKIYRASGIRAVRIATERITRK